MRYNLLVIDGNDDIETAILSAAIANLAVKRINSAEEALSFFDQKKVDFILLCSTVGKASLSESYRLLQLYGHTENAGVFVIAGSQSIAADERRFLFESGVIDIIDRANAINEIGIKLRNFIAIKHNELAAKQDLDLAKSVVLTALQSQGEQGVILRFLSDSYTCYTFKEIMEQMLKSMDSFGLKATVQIRSGLYQTEKSSFWADASVEAEFLFEHHTKGRFVEHKKSLLVNYQDVSIIIYNFMRLESEKSGRYKDHVVQLLQGAMLRVQNIKMEDELKDSYDGARVISILSREAISESTTSEYAKRTLEIIATDVTFLDSAGVVYQRNHIEDTLIRLASLGEFSSGSITKEDCNVEDISVDESGDNKVIIPIRYCDGFSLVYIVKMKSTVLFEVKATYFSQIEETIRLGLLLRNDRIALINARDDAEAASMAKSQFLATMSHEIRTPLNGVINMMGLLQRTRLDERQQRYVDTAKRSGGILLSQINDILDYSKIESGKIELENIAFDPVKLIEETIPIFSEQAASKNLEIICHINDHVPAEINGDPTRFQQVIVNLISNALKFTERGEIVIHISRLMDGRLNFGVMDTGIGIDPDALPKLFQSFTQADSTHTRKYGGTGLGLTICQRLVEAMGGELMVSSAPGLGSDFSFFLPVNSVLEKQDKHEFLGMFTRLKIVLCEKNHGVAIAFMTQLRRWGVQKITHIRSITDIDKIVDIESADLLIVGEMELTNAIVNPVEELLIPVMKYCKIIFMAFKLDEHYRTLCDKYLKKPVVYTELYNAIIDIFEPESRSAIQQLETSELDWFGSYKVLLVEDNEVNQEVVTELLNESGLVISIQENGAKALEAVKQNDYDLILMDVQMPVMDGLTACREIRKLGDTLDEKYKKLPIIAMTAHTMSGDAQKSIDAGMNDHLTKPVDPKKLFRTLKKWLQPKPGGSKEIKENEPDIFSSTAISGINIQDGLARIHGKGSVYKRILNSFYQKHRGDADILSEHFRNKDFDSLAAMFHTLKGSGGNIGANELSICAQSIESACKEKNYTALAEQMPALQANLNIVMNGIKQFLDGSESQIAKDKQVVDVAALLPVIAEFDKLLDTDLGKAQACLQKIRSRATSPSLDKIEQALDDFDIDLAHHCVADFKKQIDGAQGRGVQM